MKSGNFATLAQQEVLRVTLLQLNLGQDEKERIYHNHSQSSPASMNHFFYLCKQGLSDEARQTVYENLLDNYRSKPTDWTITNTCVKSSIEAMWEGSRREGWVIYTDASVSSYGAGWAYVVFHHGFCVNLQCSALTRCSIFTAEAQAIKHAVQYSMTIKGMRKKETVEIRSDSQAVIRALESTIIIDLMLRQVKEALRNADQSGCNIVLRWVPGHTGNEGNEMADKCAKKAVDSYICCNTMWVKRDLRMCIKRKNTNEVREKWEIVRASTPKLFFPNITCFDSFLNSAPSPELCQLATGHCRLNAFLCRIGAVSSALCACNEDNKTVVHFLLECPLYE